MGPDGDSGILAAQRENQYAASQLPETKEEQPMSTASETIKKVRVSMMNAIHDLPLLVARDEGFFKDEGLDVEILKTPGTAQRRADHQALRENVFDRTMEPLSDRGASAQFA